MGPKTGLVLLTALAPSLLAVLILGGPPLVWLGPPLICGLPFLLVLVSAAGSRPPTTALAAVWLLLTGSWWALACLSRAHELAQPSPSVAAAVTAWMLLGLGLLPLVLVALIFAISFSARGLSPEELQRLRQSGDR